MESYRVALRGAKNGKMITKACGDGVGEILI
jgi:hypothetical protein